MTTSAVRILAEATKEAAVKMVLTQGGEVDCNALTKAPRTTLKGHVAETLNEWQAMLDIRMTEAQLQWAVNIQANALAAQAVKMYREGLAA